jgi:hypothetical protein
MYLRAGEGTRGTWEQRSSLVDGDNSFVNQALSE